MSDVTVILKRLGAGDRSAAEDLLPLVYDELRRIAAAELAHERPGHTLAATALVHEAYIRLAGSEQGFEGRAHFLGSAARAIRRVLVDHARTKKREKRGGGAAMVDVSSVDPPDGREGGVVDLVDLDDALARLAEVSPRAVRVVEMRYFAGMSMPEIAVAMDISERTAAEDWSVARAWLRRALAGGESDPR